MSENKFRGVYLHNDGSGFVATIGHEGKRIYLGIFKDFYSAKSARIEAEVRLFGSVFDRRVIEICADEARIPLHGRSGVFYGWAVIDLCDIDRVKDVAWTIDPRGYVAGRPSGSKSSVTLHRWILIDGDSEVGTIDHADGNKLNNKRSNLRQCSQAENARNTKLAKNNSSGFKGVSLDVNGKWRARIWKDRKEIRIGTFSNIEDAVAAYDKAALELHGEFASPNIRVKKAA